MLPSEISVPTPLNKGNILKNIVTGATSRRKLKSGTLFKYHTQAFHTYAF